MVAHQIGQPKEQGARGALNDTAFATFLDTEDDIAVARREAFVKRNKQLRLFLQVTIDQENQVSARVRKAGHDRLVVPKVAHKIDDDNPWVSRMQCKSAFP